MAMMQTREITLKDIARKVNKSVSTVSMALADHPRVGTQTKQQINLMSRKLGYNKKIESSSLVSNYSKIKASKRFGLVLVGVKIEDEFNLSILSALSKSANSNNARFEFLSLGHPDATDAGSQEIVQRILSFASELDGLLLSDYILPETVTKICEMGIPCVVLGYAMADIAEYFPKGFVIVSPDLIQMGMLATKTLIENGHERIGFISELIPQGLDHDRWLAGYELAHRRKRLQIDSNYIHVVGKVLAGAQSAAEAMLALEKKPTAYVIPDVRIAASFIQAMHLRGIDMPCNSIVIAGETSLAKIYHLTDYPRIWGNNPKIAEVGFSYLLRLSEKNAESGSIIHTPFITYNMPPASNIKG